MYLGRLSVPIYITSSRSLLTRMATAQMFIDMFILMSLAFVCLVSFMSYVSMSVYLDVLLGASLNIIRAVALVWPGLFSVCAW